MSEQGIDQENGQTGGVTVFHLLFVMVLFLPVETVIGQINHAGGGVLRYVLAVPIAIAFGAILALLNWTFMSWLWTKVEHRSNRIQGVMAITSFCLPLASVVVAETFGSKLASLLIRLVA